jgi:hypothetical protein
VQIDTAPVGQVEFILAERIGGAGPLPDVNRTRSLTASTGARVLLESPTTLVEGRPAPVVAVREVGSGRTLAVTTDSSWFWGFVAAEEGGSNLDLAIAIRTLLTVGERVFVQAGAGIVHDSVPEAELEETRSKARAVVRALELARGAR